MAGMAGSSGTGEKPQVRAADNMALAYRWRVDEGSLDGFFSKIDGIVKKLAARRGEGFVGAHLYQPVVGPNSAIWELWIGIGPELFQELITASESALWDLSRLEAEMNRPEERTVVKLIETHAALYRAWAWPPPTAKEPPQAPNATK